MIGENKTLKPKLFVQLLLQDKGKDQEIMECQDHCYRIYSNMLNAVLETPTFHSEEDAKAYTYKVDDKWNFSDDVNW